MLPINAGSVMDDADVTIEVVLTAKVVYRGVRVEAKTGPTDYESARAALLDIISEAKKGIDRAAEKAEADRKAGV
jgi:hypothetical protein